jgi:hypothetical protein
VTKSQKEYLRGHAIGLEEGRYIATDFIKTQVDEVKRAEAAMFEERLHRVRNNFEQQHALQAALMNQRVAALNIVKQQLAAAVAAIDALL